MARIISAFKQFFDGEGNPLSGGFLKFTQSGTNATDKDTYSDINEDIPNTNPVELDGEGRAPNIFGTGTYRVVILDSELAQIDQKDPVSSNSIAGAFTNWDSVSVYNIPDIVISDDLFYYRSMTNFNSDNEPSANAENWERIDFSTYWNENITYAEDQSCLYAGDGLEYVSQVDDNLGNDPSTSPTEWFDLGTQLLSISDKLDKDANLSDVADVPTSQTNLAVYSKTAVDGRYAGDNVEKLLTNDTGATPGDAALGKGYKGKQTYGEDATGPIEIGSTLDTPADNKLISGATSKTFYDIIDSYTKSESDGRYVIFPSGLIMLWSGSIATIPTGWVLCDGLNSTPDLQNMFVVGAGDTYAVDGTGGSLTHTHADTLTSDGTTLTEAQAPSHHHGLRSTDAYGTFAFGFGYTTGNVVAGMDEDTGAVSIHSNGNSGFQLVEDTTGDTSHDHSISGSITEASAPPPYYALAYIMKT